MKKKGILERLKDGLVLGDGGYLLELEKRGWVRAGPFTPEVALMRPDDTPKQQPDFSSLPEFPLGLDPLQLTRK
jgi:betaine-homocysteine S-methyltransferase